MYEEYNEVYRLDWDIQLDGRAWGPEVRERYERTPEKLELIEGQLYLDCRSDSC